MEELKVGDIFIQDAGFNNYFIRGVLEVHGGGGARTWTLHIANNKVYGLENDTPLSLVAAWPTRKLVPDVIPAPAAEPGTEEAEVEACLPI